MKSECFSIWTKNKPVLRAKSQHRLFSVCERHQDHQGLYDGIRNGAIVNSLAGCVYWNLSRTQKEPGAKRVWGSKLPHYVTVGCDSSEELHGAHPKDKAETEGSGASGQFRPGNGLVVDPTCGLTSRSFLPAGIMPGLMQT